MSMDEPIEQDTQVDDLDVSEAEADAVTGGRRGDPCDGGEITAGSATG